LRGGCIGRLPFVHEAGEYRFHLSLFCRVRCWFLRFSGLSGVTVIFGLLSLPCFRLGLLLALYVGINAAWESVLIRLAVRSDLIQRPFSLY
jgi:hypothetical protein